MKLQNNRLLAITKAYIGMEEDVQDGKLFRERERVIYARLKDLSILNDAASADAQEQWMIKLPKTDKNQAKGSIRVRKIIPMIKGEDGFSITNVDENIIQYVLTTKAERQANDRLEVPAPVTKDMFDLFHLLAENGMIKHRYHFPVQDTDMIFEVDVFLKEGAKYHEWVKIDLELKDISVDIPELPFAVEEKIFDNTKDETEKKKISELYETVFLSKNKQ